MFVLNYAVKPVKNEKILPQKTLIEFSIRENKFLQNLLKIVIREIKFPWEKHFWPLAKSAFRENLFL